MFKFGTDGYRGIISENFDFETVGKLTFALANSLKQDKEKPFILIGYDTRFLSQKYAEYAAGIALGEGLDVQITDSFVPTPLLSFAVCDMKADAGIVITASHNPYYYNGFKIKNKDGGSATPEQISALEPFLNGDINVAPNNFHKSPDCNKFNPKISYSKHIEQLVDKNIFKDSNIKIVVDPMYGAGRSYFKELLENYSLDVKEIHSINNPSFGGLHPEPINQHLSELREAVLENKADIGLALDGDADRSGVIDEKGNFVNSHQIFALLLYHLVENKKQKGLVVKTYSTTSLVDIMCHTYGLELVQTPIGFKHISDLMLKKDVLIGGEESGGLGIKGHLPERDGMLIGLMLTELMVYSKKKISELINELYERFGTFSYNRIDKIINTKSKYSLYQNLAKANISNITNKDLKQLFSNDGYKYQFSDNSWLMFRLSGTESVVRIYAEAENEHEVSQLLTHGERIVTELTDA